MIPDASTMVSAGNAPPPDPGGGPSALSYSNVSSTGGAPVSGAPMVPWHSTVPAEEEEEPESSWVPAEEEEEPDHSEWPGDAPGYGEDDDPGEMGPHPQDDGPLPDDDLGDEGDEDDDSPEGGGGALLLLALGALYLLFGT